MPASTSAPKPGHPFAFAFGALVLALTTPAIVALAAKLGTVAGTLTTISTPLIALAILFAFAFHVRFALGALQAEKKAPSLVASVAILVGVTGFVGAMLVLMGIVRPSP